jgi:hypothetical protein
MLYSLSPTANGNGEWVSLLGPASPGSYDLASCGFVTLCPGVSGGFDQSLPNTPKEGERTWRLTTGSIVIRRPSQDGRVRGTFSGTGPAFQFTAGEWRQTGQISVTSGTFEADLAPWHPSI